MEGNVPVPGWNAHRHPQDPLRPPNYRFQDVPKCKRGLEGSVLHEITDRDQFKEIMAEMVLLCTEAMRRASANRCSSKPLSLEYIADRLDVDDPCFGYTVRSKDDLLQGFITVTTFTNWQKNFRWDSLHELAFYYDDSDSEDEEIRHQPRKERVVDRDGSLSRELQQSVRLGDPYNEGIVWPRIAEISLLGALGCGRALVQLMIEHLEFQKPSTLANYDYIALQATDNSIPFYESLGFVRVGAVTVQEDDKPSERPSNTGDSSSNSSDESSAEDAIPVEPSSPEKPEVLAVSPDIVSSPVSIYEVKRAGETLNEVAKKHKTSVWDIIFLNKELYTDLVPKCRLRKGTILHVPKQEKTSENQNEANSPTKWFIAKENDTPRKIAKKFGIPCKALVEANMNRLPELQAASRLKEGTRVKVSNLDQHDDVCNPYCHWSFPDDSSVEGGEPSYMMVYKLDRKNGRDKRLFRNSLKTSITNHYPPKRLLDPPPKTTEKYVVKHPPPPKPPKEPLLAFDIFKQQQRDVNPSLRKMNEATDRILDERWCKLSDSKKSRYNDVAIQTRKHYDREYQQYEDEYAKWKIECANRPPTLASEKDSTLFNKVVKLSENALEGKEYKYWFVLTYIPDLKWCHLAPMVQDGVFGPERKRSQGRPKWRLVEESLGQELDISSMYCTPVKSKTMKRTADADKEEWDILDGVAGMKSSEVPVGVDAVNVASRPIRKQPMRSRIATKPMNGNIVAVKQMQSSVKQSIEQASPASSAGRSTPSPRRTPLWSRSKRRRGTPPRFSNHTPTKSARLDTDTTGMSRKARKLNHSGARRSVLQS